MNPFKYAQMMKYLTRAKKQKPDLPDVFPASQAPIPPIKPEVKQREAINEFIRRERQKKAGGGMLVQPGFGGTRQGYKDDNLPDFITKTDTGYRVRSKKTKLNPAVSENFDYLKDAKAFVREKNLVRGKTGVQYPELVAKAQGVVDDYNDLLEKAVANNDLRNVKFFERYVKDRFKKTSDQNQILRQVYKKKLNYKDLTDARLTVADNLIAEIMKQEKIIAQDAIYERLGGKSGLKGKILKKISKGLKNQTKIKVDNAVAAIVEADEIIDDSFIKTVANRIGRTQFGAKTGEVPAWRKALNKNKYYKENKELLDYAFSAGGKRTRAPGMSLTEILDDAKYKKGGGVTFSGKQTQFSGLRRYIFDYAKQHWHRNNFDGNPEKSLIEFYDKNGEPIKWKAGSKLKLSEVQFKIPSESNIMWSYNGAKAGGPKGSVSVTGPIADRSGIFREVTETYNVLKDISDAEVTNPITKQKTTYNDLVSKIYKDGYGYQGKNVFGLDIDHFKGVKDHPFKNLRAMDKRLNISLGAIDKNFDNRNLKSKLKREMLGKLATTTGSSYNKALKNYFINQATNVLDRGITKTLSASDRLAAKSPYYAAVKSVYEQKNLPKVQKELLKKSYGRALKLVASLGDGSCPVQFGEGKGNKDGGRIGYATGPVSFDKCIESGAKNFNDGNLKTADQIKDGAKLLRGGRAVLSAISKYGVVPELAYVGLEAAGRTVLGEQPTNALLKSIDTLTFGATDFTSGIEAEKFGEYAKDKLAVDKFQESQAKVRSILDNISRLEELNLEGGDIDVTQNIQTLKAQLQSASDELRANTVNPDMVQFITQRGDEIADAELAKSPFAQQSLTDQLEGFPGIKDYTDTEATRVFPFQQTQQQLNEKVLPTPFILRAKTSDIINDIVPALRAQGVTVDGRPIGTKDVLNYQKQLREQPLSEVVAQGFNPESLYGASGTFSTPLPGGALDKKPNVIPEMEREIVGQTNVANPFDIDISDIGSGLRGFSAAGGGIAKQAGVSSGPPPESGPNSQGLQGLMKRVRNL